MSIHEIKELAKKSITKKSNTKFGQFFTSDNISRYMASLFQSYNETVQLLDPGAGIGSLTAAFVNEMCSKENPPKKISVVLYEIDNHIIKYLENTLDVCYHEAFKYGIDFSATIKNQDFIKIASDFLPDETKHTSSSAYNCIILNPPYKKFPINSEYKKLLNNIGIDVTNLYSAFLALAERTLLPNGEMVAITPRSFCNGPYFLNFRKSFLSTMSLDKIHTFVSRDTLFKLDKVLQENIIFHAVKQPKTLIQSVSILSSHSADFLNVSNYTVPSYKVVSPNDPDLFIHLPTELEDDIVAQKVENLSSSLFETGMNVSTGKIVDFRVDKNLLGYATDESIPLIYPSNFKEGFINWPNNNNSRPNALKDDSKIKSLLLPKGYYVLVKRFSSKEERKRIVAAIYNPTLIESEYIGFENHLNYFHINGRGLPKEIAYGLYAFLNSSELDKYFRQFSGHTQVNVTDLRKLKYPSFNILEKAGKVVEENLNTHQFLDQQMINHIAEQFFFTEFKK